MAVTSTSTTSEFNTASETGRRTITNLSQTFHVARSDSSASLPKRPPGSVVDFQSVPQECDLRPQPVDYELSVVALLRQLLVKIRQICHRGCG